MMEDGPAFPHSTVEGYRLGCHMMGCIGKERNGISCVEVFTKYSGDYQFRRLVDGGAFATVADLAEYVQADEKRMIEALGHHPKAPPKPRPKAAPKPAPKPRQGNRISRRWTEEEVETLKRMADDPETTVAHIAEVLHRPASSVSRKRLQLGYESRNHPVQHGTRGGYEKGCTGDDCPANPSCAEVGRAYWRQRSEQRRRELGVEPRKWRT